MAAPKTGSLGVGTTKGDLFVVDANGDLERLPVGTVPGSALVVDSTQPLGLKYSAGSVAGVVAQSDVIPFPLAQGLGAQSSRADQILLEGGPFYIFQPASVDRLVFRITALAGAPTTTLSLGIYQAANGGEGVASKIGTITNFAPAAVGNQEAAFTEGVISLSQGIFYILLGRTSVGGSYSTRTYTIQPYDLMNQNMQVTYPRPVSYTTIIAPGALPATFDPRVGGDAVATSLNIVPVIRFRHT